MIAKDNKAFNDALTRFNGMCEAYTSMFGENSLDRVIVIHPNEITVEELDDSTKMLAAAIANNEPLEQFDEELWEHVRY
nr:MAG TPA: Golgi resident protein GCP60, 3A, GOLD, 3A, Aichivirus, Antiviral.0A [Caudoviricetes sp.]